MRDRARVIPEPEKRESVALFETPAVRTGRQQLWPTEGPLDLDGKDLWRSRDAQGLRLAFATQVRPVDIALPDVMIGRARRPALNVHIDEWLRQYVGPRPGLTPADNEAAHRDLFLNWFGEREAETRGQWWVAGIVPPNWSQAFRDMYVRLINPTFTPLAPLELCTDERGGFLVWGELRAMLGVLRA